MALTVRQLISALRRMPGDSIVAWRDHDQGDTEVNAFVRTVERGTHELACDDYVNAVMKKEGAETIVLIGP